MFCSVSVQKIVVLGAAKTVQRKGNDGGDFGANFKIIPISSKYR